MVLEVEYELPPAGGCLLDNAALSSWLLFVLGCRWTWLGRSCRGQGSVQGRFAVAFICWSGQWRLPSCVQSEQSTFSSTVGACSCTLAGDGWLGLSCLGVTRQHRPICLLMLLQLLFFPSAVWLWEVEFSLKQVLPDALFWTVASAISPPDSLKCYVFLEGKLKESAFQLRGPGRRWQAQLIGLVSCRGRLYALAPICFDDWCFWLKQIPWYSFSSQSFHCEYNLPSYYSFIYPDQSDNYWAEEIRTTKNKMTGKTKLMKSNALPQIGRYFTLRSFAVAAAFWWKVLNIEMTV